MKFMVMHKADAISEAEPLPTQELLDNVGKLVQSAIDSGKMVDGAGLRSSARRVRVSLQGDQRSVQHGPYEGQNELVSDIAQLKVKSMPEAIEWGTRFAKATGARELEIGPVTEPWDLGVAEKPAGEVPLQVLALLKSTKEAEAGKAPSGAALDAFVSEATTAGVLVSRHALLPSSKGARLSGAKGTRRVIDGPFSESKELIGGFMIMLFDSKDEAIRFAMQYADAVGAEEVDVHELA